jgi:DNA-binding response OmpR family regulator
MARTRLLLIDDQQGALDLYSRYFPKSSFEVFTASKVESAIQMFVKRPIDVIVTDLHMPPGEWGGMGLIETALSLRSAVPIVVLSEKGLKGSRTKAVQALRLGAYDYVEKSVAEEVLLDVVDEALEWRTNQLKSGSSLQENLPFPIAAVHRDFVNQSMQLGRFKRLVDFIEVSIKYLTIVAFAALRHSRPDPIPVLSAGMDRPSLGHWKSSFENIIAVCRSSGAIWPLDWMTNIYGKQLRRAAEGLVSLRNRYEGHGAKLPDWEYKRLVDQHLLQAVSFVEAMEPALRGRLVCVTSMKYVDRKFIHQTRECMGNNRNFSAAVITTDFPLASDQLWVIDEDRGCYLPLHPFLVMGRAMPYGMEGIMYYDKVLDKSQVAYLDYEFGQSFETTTPASELGDILHAWMR